MNAPVVICDHGQVQASLVPDIWLGPPGRCPHGVYDTLLWENGTFKNFHQHIQRITSSCKALGVPIPPALSHLSVGALADLVRHNAGEYTRARLRLMVFQDEQKPISGKKISFIASALASPVTAKPHKFHCAVSPSLRSSGDASFNHKLLGRIEELREFEQAAAMGFYDVLWFNNRDELCEGMYSNVWVVSDDEILTPPVQSPCLPGVTRASLLQSNLQGYLVKEKIITRKIMARAREVFLTSTIRGIQPVTQVDGIWKGERGPVAVLLATRHAIP